MANSIRVVDYYYTRTPDEPGEGSRLLGLFRQAGVSFLALLAFPERSRSQLDLVPEDPSAFLEAAKANDVELEGPKKAFLIEGDDRVGALHDPMSKLASAGINVTAVSAVSSGGGRYGALLWVKPGDVRKATSAMGAE